jgi:two-component system response regulator HydG
MRAGAYDFLVKPTPLDELELALERALDHAQVLRQNRILRSLADRDATSDIRGESRAIRELRASIGRIAASDASVLVFGENGTGKELVARAIHAASPRRDAAFVVVNCGAIPSELFESELFGHLRGAFTGADKKRLGLIELAEGGTLFLDEVGELPVGVQPALLRAVQFGEFRPVGAEKSEVADVRVVAATNGDLREAVRKGEFREDLYHRISTLGIVVPPLRERGDDVQSLAELFLERYNEKVSAEFAKRFSPAALSRLGTHPWTGNVRELENVVVRLVTLTEGRTIEAADVERHLAPIGARLESDTTLDLQSIERATVVRALRRHGGHRARAAAELGLAVKTLYNKIRQHGIAEEEWTG